AVLVHPEVVVTRPLDRTREVAGPVFAAEGEARALRGQRAAPAGPDVDHARPGARAVQRGGGRALDDLDALDVEGRQVDARLREYHVVDDDERCVAAVDARRRAEEDRGLRAGPRAGHHRDARDAALHGGERLARRRLERIRADAADGERHHRAAGRLGHARDDDLAQAQDLRAHLEVEARALALPHDHALAALGGVAEELDHDGVGAWRNRGDAEAAIGAGQGAQRRSLDDDLRADERRAAVRAARS